MSMNHSFVSKMLIYDYTIFTAYINGVIKVESLPKSLGHFLEKNNIKGDFNIQTNEEYIYEMLAYKGVLFVSTDKKLLGYRIENNRLREIEFFSKSIIECVTMKVDSSGRLFAVSENRGLIVLNISDPLSPKYVCDISLNNYFGNPVNVIADMDLVDNTIFLALRNKGILRIDYNGKIKSLSNELIYTSVEKLMLKDPQDVKFNKINNFLYIVDAEEGLVIIDTNYNSMYDSVQLPNQDTPVKIIIYKEDCFIQGNKGLYYYHTLYREISIILDYKIGEINKYYNNLIYYKKGKLNIIILGKNGNKLNELVFNYSGNYLNKLEFNEIYTFSKNVLEKIK